MAPEVDHGLLGKLSSIAEHVRRSRAAEPPPNRLKELGKSAWNRRGAPQDRVPRAKSALSDSDSLEDESDEEAFGWDK